MFFASDVLLLFFSFRWPKSWPFYPRSLEVTITAFQKGSPFSPSPKKKGHVRRLVRLICLVCPSFPGNRQVVSNTTHRSRSKANRQWLGSRVCVPDRWVEPTELSRMDGMEVQKLTRFGGDVWKNINQNGFIFPPIFGSENLKNGSNNLKILKSKKMVSTKLGVKF